MKVVALALALLLAVGSQAASLQADAPSQLEQFRSAMDIYLTNVKDSAKRVLDQLDGTDYSSLKEPLSQRLDTMHENIKSVQGAVAPMTDTIVATLSETTADMRAAIATDVEELKRTLEARQENLRKVLEKHMEDYRSTLEPIVKAHYDRHAAEMGAIRAEIESAATTLREKIDTNVEETKAALIPMVETVRAKLTERGEEMKTLFRPYVEEYKDQLQAAYMQAQNVDPAEITALRDKITPMAEDIKAKLQEIFTTIASYVQKN